MNQTLAALGRMWARATGLIRFALIALLAWPLFAALLGAAGMGDAVPLAALTTGTFVLVLLFTAKIASPDALLALVIFWRRGRYAVAAIAGFWCLIGIYFWLVPVSSDPRLVPGVLFV